MGKVIQGFAPASFPAREPSMLTGDGSIKFQKSPLYNDIVLPQRIMGMATIWVRTVCSGLTKLLVDMFQMLEGIKVHEHE